MKRYREETREKANSTARSGLEQANNWGWQLIHTLWEHSEMFRRRVDLLEPNKGYIDLSYFVWIPKNGDSHSYL